MQKLLKRLLIAAFFVILILPCCIAAAQGINTDNLPQFIDSDKKLNIQFDEQMNEFVNDNQPFYESAVICGNYIKSALFKSETANVITGKDGYYFYSETKDDILHTNTLTDREIYNIANNLELIGEYCKNNNCKFVFTIAPNKATIVPQYLPNNFAALRQESTFQKLESELAKHDVDYADVKSVLIQSDGQAYLKGDTHWNNYGALLAFNKIAETAQSNVSPQLKDTENFSRRNDFDGDLSAMLYKEKAKSDNQYYADCLDDIEKSIRIRIRGEKSRKSDELIKKIASADENYVRIDAKSSHENSNGNLLMLRDSFCRSMFPYFAYSYKSSTFIKSSTYDAYVNPCEDYNLFVFEIVERNIGDILENEQRIPAPVRDDINPAADISDKQLATVNISNEYAHYTIIDGEMDCSLLQNEENIFVKVTDTGTGDCRVYEAFAGKKENNKFRYYMTTDDFVIENADIQVIVNNTVVAKTSV